MELVLDHAEHGNVKPHLRHDLPHRVHVPHTAVQQNQVGHTLQCFLCIDLPGITDPGYMIQPPQDRFPHGTVVVLSRLALDFEGTVIAFGQLAVDGGDHACGDMLGTQIGNIVGFDPLGQYFQLQQRRQMHQHFLFPVFPFSCVFRMQLSVRYRHVAQVF